ncbi:hypothetical protein STEG23_035973 [Scotinomys teguina]
MTQADIPVSITGLYSQKLKSSTPIYVQLDYWSSALCFDVNLCIFFHRLVEEGSMMAEYFDIIFEVVSSFFIALFLMPEDNLCDIGIIANNLD